MAISELQLEHVRKSVTTRLSNVSYPTIHFKFRKIRSKLNRALTTQNLVLFSGSYPFKSYQPFMTRSTWSPMTTVKAVLPINLVFISRGKDVESMISPTPTQPKLSTYYSLCMLYIDDLLCVCINKLINIQPDNTHRGSSSKWHTRANSLTSMPNETHMCINK